MLYFEIEFKWQLNLSKWQLQEIDSLALMPCSKLFSYRLSFITLDNCYSFNLTYMIKVLGLNVIYKTIDL